MSEARRIMIMNKEAPLTLICILHIPAQRKAVLDAGEELDAELAFLARGEERLGAVARGGGEGVVRLSAGEEERSCVCVWGWEGGRRHGGLFRCVKGVFWLAGDILGVGNSGCGRREKGWSAMDGWLGWGWGYTHWRS